MPVVSAVEPLSAVYPRRVNPQWAYEHASGCELFTSDGRRILDFRSGYGVHNAAYNHPAVVKAPKEELDRSGPAMLQSHVSPLAAQLAEVVTEEQLDEFTAAVREVVDLAHNSTSFWSEALGLARRVAHL